MLTTIIRRLLQGLVVLFGIIVLTFVILRLIPGDPARVMAADSTAANLEQMRAAMGLDKPIVVQLMSYLSGLLTGDLGWSYFQKMAVSSVIGQTIGLTAALLFFGMLLGLMFGLIFGVLAAIYSNTWADRVLSALAVGIQSMPTYWIATMLMLLISVKLGWLPSIGYKSPSYLVLPSIIVSLPVMAVFLRTVRSNVMEGIQQEFCKAARARGISNHRILTQYAFRNSMVPFLTQVGGQIGIIIGTCILIEYIFSIPGMGLQILTAIQRRDYNLVQGIISVLALFFVVINTLVDLSYAYLDPRIRKAQGGL